MAELKQFEIWTEILDGERVKFVAEFGYIPAKGTKLDVRGISDDICPAEDIVVDVVLSVVGSVRLVVKCHDARMVKLKMSGSPDDY